MIIHFRHISIKFWRNSHNQLRNDNVYYVYCLVNYYDFAKILNHTQNYCIVKSICYENKNMTIKAKSFNFDF